MIIEVTGTLARQHQTREWCRLPYPGHPDGCPNYNHSVLCPPRVATVDEVFDLSKPHWFVIVSFDMAAHVKTMSEKHPKWSDRQLRCCLYWQNTVRKNLGIEILGFMATKSGGTIATMIPEAMGVNVFRTCHRHGLMLRKDPKEIVYKIALVGYGWKKEQDSAAQIELEL